MATPKTSAADAAKVASLALSEMAFAEKTFTQLASLFSAIEECNAPPHIAGLAQIGQQFASWASERLESEHESYEGMLLEAGE